MCRVRSLFSLVMLAVVLMLCSALSVLGAEVHIQPILNVGGEYNDNYFSTPNNKTDVWITRLSPGINIEALTDRSRLNMKYLFTYNWYNGENGSFDASSLDYPGHDLSFYAASKIFSRLTMGMDETFLLTSDPQATDDLSQIINPSEYWRNRVSPFLVYDIAEKGEIKVSYRNEVLDYTKTFGVEREDSMENRGLVALTYHFNDRNHLSLENLIWHRTYDGDVTSDYDAYQSMLIYRHQFNSFMEGHIGGGAQYRDFTDEALGSLTRPAFQLGLDLVTDITKLQFYFEHNFNDFAQDNSYYMADRVGVSAERLFLDRIRAFGGGYYQYSDYEDVSRQDDTYNLRAGMGYLFWEKRLELSAEYNYTKRESSEPDNDYVQNRVLVRLSMHYDFGEKSGK